MALGLVFYDVLYLILSTTLYGGALTAGGRVFVTLEARLPWAVALILAGFSSLLVLIGEVAVLTALLPRLVPGRYTLMRGRVFYGWVLRSLLRRVLFVPGLKFVLFSSNVLRWLSLRALGADVAFTANLSNDADLLDPALTTLEPGATVGARCLLSGHYVEDGKLVLGRIHVGARSLLAVEVMVGPEARVGAGTLVKGRSTVSIGVQIGDDAVIGGQVGLDAYCRVGAGAKLGNCVYVAPRNEIPAGAEVPALAQIRG
jgi:carbonic anhydrase/acetyltransferase-like protein (isoleucine patch superfamily)